MYDLFQLWLRNSFFCPCTVSPWCFHDSRLHAFPCFMLDSGEIVTFFLFSHIALRVRLYHQHKTSADVRHPLQKDYHEHQILPMQLKILVTLLTHSPNCWWQLVVLSLGKKHINYFHLHFTIVLFYDMSVVNPRRTTSNACRTNSFCSSSLDADKSTITCSCTQQIPT